MVKPIPVMQTRLKLLFTKTGKDVTESLAPDLLSFSYDDNESGQADEITVDLKDETGKWASTWMPNGGESVQAFILEGNADEVLKTLLCGKFYVDELSAAGSPRTFQIKAVSIPLNKPIRRKAKTRAWEEKGFFEIAHQLALESDMELLWDCEFNPRKDRTDQRRESDLQFLSRMCEEYGLSLKVTDSKIVIFDQKLYEKKKPVLTLTFGMSNILNWNFSIAQSDTFRTCTVMYYEATEDQYYKVTYTDPLADENGQEYKIKERAKSKDEARQMAEKKLRSLNARKATGSITLVGNILLSAGSVIECKGFGSFDGKFIIEKASHKIQGGYTTTVELRRVNNVY